MLGSSSKCTQLKSFYRYYFGRCSSDLARLVPISHSWGTDGRLLVIIIDCMTFLSTFLQVIKNIYVNSIFPRTARVSACRTFSFDLWSINGFSLELRDTFYLQVLCKWTSCMLYSFRTFFFGTPCLVVTVQPRMEWNPLKKNKKFSQAEWKISEPKSWWINIS